MRNASCFRVLNSVAQQAIVATWVSHPDPSNQELRMSSDRMSSRYCHINILGGISAVLLRAGSSFLMALKQGQSQFK